MAEDLKNRSEINLEDTWNLKDMFESDEAWEKELSSVMEAVEELAKMEGKVCESAENLYYCEKLNDSLNVRICLLYQYAFQSYDSDTGESVYQSMRARIYNSYSIAAEKLAFLSPEIIACDEEKLNSFYAEKKELELYRRDIYLHRRCLEHSLSPEIEKILAATMPMKATPEDTYSVLENADMVFPTITGEDGEPVQITQGRYIPLITSANREVRKNTYEGYYGEYIKLKNTFASLYYGQIKQLSFTSKVRHYSSNLEASVFANEIPEAVYHNLIDTVNKNVDKLHRYVRLRKKCLNLDELRMYDIYTPMVADYEKKYSFAEAENMILEALKPMGERYLSVVKKALAERWIDKYENKGKRSGGYCSGQYGVHPYILLNYNGTMDNVFTLIHEMGHAMHSYFSNTTQPSVYSQYVIFVAEVASTCNEILLFDYLMKKTDDINEKKYLLNQYLDMFKGTLFRQTQFAEFELSSNEMVEHGEALTSEILCKLYDDINKKYYGPDMTYDELIPYEWERIPHFYMNFYVYQYSTSFCASVAIAKKLLNGELPVDKYVEFLSGGCSDTPINLLKKLGIDMTGCEAFQSALDEMDSVLEQFENIDK